MPLKKLHIGFDLEIKDLIEYITERDVTMKIDAYGTPPKVPKKAIAAPPPMLALPPPGKRPTVKNIVLTYFAAHPDEKAATSALRELSVAAGHAPSTLHGQLWLMRQDGTVKQAGKGFYRITARGLREVHNAQAHT